MCSPSCFDWWSRLSAVADLRNQDGGLSRRGFLAAAAVPIVATACATVGAPPSGPTRELLAATLSFDLHSHPGLFRSTSNDSLAGHRQAAEAGLVKLISLTATSDAPVLGRNSRGGLYATREPRPGELYASMYSQLDALRGWSASAGMPTVLSVTAAEDPGPPVRGLLAVEGSDFLEGRVDRVQEAFDRGIRSLQLVHYRVNELGDIQTAPPVHGGLTAFGRAVVREMNRWGMVVDVAHATPAVVAGVVETTTQPIILSHSNIQDATGWARFISPEHARLVAKTGGASAPCPSSSDGAAMTSAATCTTSRVWWTWWESTTSAWAPTWMASAPAPSSPATRAGPPSPPPCSTMATEARRWRKSLAATPSASSGRSRRHPDRPERSVAVW